jgi:hypothetical protein
LRHDVASDTDATTNADRAPDSERDRFRKPPAEMRKARTNPTHNLTISSPGTTLDIADIIGDDASRARGGCFVLST